MTDTLNPRAFGPFESIDGIQYVYASFWEATLIGGKSISLLNDQIDPFGDGVTAESFVPFVRAGEVYAFARKEGWAARVNGSSAWTKLYKTKAGAVKAAMSDRKAEQAKHRGKPSPFARDKRRSR
ncbi:hypothetical protein HOU03_gp426 [Caulobacter phage CcrSC]|uniref:Uncharacterized protein n=1 Tax=Caulobacter phage CcrSC TaxID=2283272 RepID=A0A385EG05_9CAUD|nr:hypothetical protein HOU03_gp426 [Caulobacter phage CcrSC]AXQ69842.1 hypothetical protein CcrSC_gp260c [Caulobacter phage CcrSC]